MSIQASDFACVYVWRGSSFQIVGSGSFPSFGHVALETQLDGKTRYISFWPGNCNTKRCSQKKPHFHDKEVDSIYETRSPDASYKLHNLDIKKINDWFDANKDDLTWVLRGSSIIKGPHEFNCAGLTYRLLEEGGLEDANPVIYKTKRKILGFVSACLVFIPICYWSNRMMEPIAKFPTVISELMMEGMNIEDVGMKLFKTSLLAREHLQKAAEAAYYMNNLELTHYPELQETILPIANVYAQHGLNKLNQGDNVFFQNFPDAGNKSIILKDLIIVEFDKYSPFLTLAGAMAITTVVLGVGISLLHNKLVTDTITPNDVELLAERAIARESGNSTSISSLQWIVCTVGLTSVAYYFFKDTLFFNDILKQRLT